MTLQNNLANYSFLSLFISMIFYWIGSVFPRNIGVDLNRDWSANQFPRIPSPNPASAVSVEGTALPMEEVVGHFSSKSLTLSTISANVSKYAMIFSNILLATLLILRWKESGHFPLSNLYESLMFLSWCFTGIQIYIENSLFPNQTTQITTDRFSLGTPQFVQLLGAITSPSALLTNAFAGFTLPKDMQEISPLVPALQSNWLFMHVTVMILSYAALIIGSLLSIAFLVITAFLSSAGKDSSSRSEDLPTAGKNLTLTLDNLSYRILGIGFPLLTVGILSGAVWANEAWGSYWSWDPKETWALLTWLVFAIYLHTRLSKGWEGKRPAIIASIGFVVVWICYLGVNLIGEGLHSYGWLS